MPKVKIAFVVIGISLFFLAGAFLVKRFHGDEKEERLLSDLRLVAYPHNTLHNAENSQFYGELKFSNLYRYSRNVSNDDFGLIYVADGRRYQLSWPSGNCYRFNSDHSWRTWVRQHSLILHAISESNLWHFIEPNTYQNNSGTEVRRIEELTTYTLSSSNWLINFWTSNHLAGCFVSCTNSYRLFYPASQHGGTYFDEKNGAASGQTDKRENKGGEGALK